jgi:Bacterial Ig-like domain
MARNPASTHRRRARRPLLFGAAALGALIAASPAWADVNLPFDGASGGIVGSGFTDTQSGTPAANTGLLNLAAGHLGVTSTDGLGASQVNALQVSPAMTAGTSYFAEASLAMPNLTKPYQEAGIWVGTDVNHNVKLTVQQGPSGPQVELYRATDSTLLAHHRLLPAGVTDVTLTLQVNTVANVVVGKYNLFNGATQIGNTQSAGYVLFSGMGTAGDRIGIQTSNFGATGFPITASYDLFKAGPQGVDVTPPDVTSASPGPNQTGVAATTAVTVGFNDVMDPSSMGGFTLSGPGGPVAASVDSVAGSGAKQFVLTPFAPLTAGGTYTVNLSGDVRDQYGNPLAARSWSFTVAGGAAAGAGGTAPPAGGGTTAGGTTVPILAPATKNATALKVSLSATRTVKRGGRATLTLRFSRVPSTLVTVSRKQGKAFKSVLKQRSTKKLTILKVPVGTKLGKARFRVSYKDGAITRTSLFSVTVIR